VGRRPDGYHELESLFLPLDLADELELSLALRSGTQVELSLEGEAGVPAGDENLAARAARRFLEVAGLEGSASIRLRKHIPAAGGMGGGSSDAAAVLLGLARLAPGTLGQARLRELALELGADVPFFLDPRPSLVTGVGEHCEPLPPPWPGRVLLLANPGQPLATAAVFRAYDEAAAECTEASHAPARGDRAFSDLVRRAARDPEALASLLSNDLEQAARALCPAIAPLRERLLDAGARAVGLSGSGATLFGVFDAEDRARAALRAFTPPAWARVARTAEAR